MSKDIAEKKIQYLRGLLRRLYSRDQFDIHDKIIVFHDRLKKKYPDHQRYKLYHLISLSTYRDSMMPTDFPGKDSIEQFIISEYQKVFSKEEMPPLPPDETE